MRVPPYNPDLNIYYDRHSGSWVREIRDYEGRWHVVGVYGTKDAAVKGQ